MTQYLLMLDPPTLATGLSNRVLTKTIQEEQVSARCTETTTPGMLSVESYYNDDAVHRLIRDQLPPHARYQLMRVIGSGTFGSLQTINTVRSRH